MVKTARCSFPHHVPETSPYGVHAHRFARGMPKSQSKGAKKRIFLRYGVKWSNIKRKGGQSDGLGDDMDELGDSYGYTKKFGSVLDDVSFWKGLLLTLAGMRIVR